MFLGGTTGFEDEGRLEGIGRVAGDGAAFGVDRAGFIFFFFSGLSTSSFGLRGGSHLLLAAVGLDGGKGDASLGSLEGVA